MTRNIAAPNTPRRQEKQYVQAEGQDHALNTPLQSYKGGTTAKRDGIRYIRITLKLLSRYRNGKGFVIYGENLNPDRVESIIKARLKGVKLTANDYIL